MIRATILGVAMAVTLAQLAQAQPPVRQLAADPNASYSYRILNKPTSSDERAIRTIGLQPEAQHRSDRLFASLVSLLGGTAPGLNFVPSGSPLIATSDTSANIAGKPGAPQGTINVNPLVTEGLINNASPYHSGSVNRFPHEMAHLRQTVPTLADLMQREGGAQAFADLVTPTAAQRAGIPYRVGNYDGSYAPLVSQAQAKGRDWLLAGQFGNTGSPTWP